MDGPELVADHGLELVAGGDGVLPKPLFMADQAPQTALRAGAYPGSRTTVSQSSRASVKARVFLLRWVLRLSPMTMTGAPRARRAAVIRCA